MTPLKKPFVIGVVAVVVVTAAAGAASLAELRRAVGAEIPLGDAQ